MLLPLMLSAWFLAWHIGNKRNSSVLTIFSFGFLGACAYTYVAARLLIPILAIGVIVLFFKERNKSVRILFIGLIVLSITLIPLISHAVDQPEKFALRYEQVSIFNNSPSVPAAWKSIASNYFSHFSIAYLFATGDANLRHSQLGIGVLLWAQFPFLIVGLLTMMRRRHKEELMILLWLIAGPLPAALSIDGSPHALRSIGMMLPCLLITAIGVGQFIKWSQKKQPARIALYVLASITVLETAWIAYDLLSRYPIYSAEAWEYGVLEAIETGKRFEHNYDEIWFTSKAIGADRTIALALKIPPDQFRKTSLASTTFRWHWAAPISYIASLETPLRRLFVVRENELAGWSEVTEPILRPDGSIAFRFVEETHDDG